MRDVIGRVRRDSPRCSRLPDGYEIVLGNGGTTAFFDLATFCLIERESQHCSFGDFSARFATAVRPPLPTLRTREILARRGRDALRRRPPTTPSTPTP